ncbi:MAG: iron-containing alcohol dehydrogenase [Alphaproteobacteria bacterium]|nr:iron-containing alcohol dehydrogenase [Alphaproteobacteria bacterium]
MTHDRLPGLPSRHGARPAEVVIGDVLALLPPAVREAGMSRVLLVTDPGLVATGWPGRAAEVLAAAGCAVDVFDGVVPNPTSADAARGADAYARAGADGLVALGGGSALDTAKAVGFLVANGGVMEDWWGFGKAPRPLPPLVAVPTTAGTGSEVQSFALISRATDHRKMACGATTAMPRTAILDADLTLSAPRSVTITAGLDALVHALETAVTTAGTDASRMVATQAFARLWPALPRAVERPDDLAARTQLLLGACQAGQAIEASMLGAAHAAANPLTARFDLDHGLAVAWMAPGVIRFNGAHPAVADRYAPLAAIAGVDGPEGLAVALEGLLAQLGVAADLAGIGVRSRDVPALAEDAAGQWTAGFNPVPVTAADVEGFYRALP